MAKVYAGLVHHPVYNRKGEIITTAVTNLDIHDIARSAQTYGLDGYYLIQPDKEQQELCRDILSFWQDGYGKKYNPDRAKALELVQSVDSIAECIDDISKKNGEKPQIVVTSAKDGAEKISYQEMRQKLATDETYLILFGTGWGLSEEVMANADYRLPPIQGAGEYNHLSVRSAAAIVFDRLLGK